MDTTDSRAGYSAKLTDFRIPKVHDGKAVILSTVAYNAEVKDDSVEFTVWRCVVPCTKEVRSTAQHEMR